MSRPYVGPREDVHPNGPAARKRLGSGRRQDETVGFARRTRERRALIVERTRDEAAVAQADLRVAGVGRVCLRADPAVEPGGVRRRQWVAPAAECKQRGADEFLQREERRRRISRREGGGTRGGACPA